MFIPKEGISQGADEYTPKISIFLSSHVASLRILEEGQVGIVSDHVISEPSNIEAVALKTLFFSSVLSISISCVLENGSKFHIICIHIRETLASVLDHP